MMADAIASLTATTADAKAITAARITRELMWLQAIASALALLHKKICWCNRVKNY
jgi:hypothetical protein